MKKFSLSMHTQNVDRPENRLEEEWVERERKRKLFKRGWSQGSLVKD